jgi:hypothetical protein
MYDGKLDKDLTRDQVIERNLKVVEAHFHNENPESVDKAIALYADDVIWEAPLRGIVMTDPAEIKESYMGIFQTVKFNKTTSLRRFATEEYVFDDQIGDIEIVGTKMENLGYKVGDRCSVRLTHVFFMRDGKIRREIAYEGFRPWGGATDHDSVPADALVTIYDPSKFS